MLQTSALWHAMTRSPQCKARCSKHISISDLLGYFLKSGTTERHLIVLWNFKTWSNMKFICNIPLNVTKYINNVKKKKLNQSENFWKTAFTTLICSQRNTTSDSCVCPAKCLKMTTANQDCTKNFFHNYKIYSPYFNSFQSHWNWGNNYIMHM